jgi:hypothetical protein
VKRARRPAGQSLIESAFVLAAFMGLLLGMLGIGQLLFIRQTLMDRARTAARWGALNCQNAPSGYDPAAIRRVVLYGTPTPAAADSAFFGLTPEAVKVSDPGCPGPACRVIVAIPEHGIRSVEIAESATPILAASQP